MSLEFLRSLIRSSYQNGEFGETSNFLSPTVCGRNWRQLQGNACFMKNFLLLKNETADLNIQLAVNLGIVSICTILHFDSATCNVFFILEMCPVQTGECSWASPDVWEKSFLAVV